MKFSVVILLGSLALAAPTFAQQKADDHSAHHPAGIVAVTAAADLTDGEVRKIDKAAGKLTLRHGEIRNLGMPPMTMVFTVKQVASLEALTPGAKVRFKAALDGGTLTATDIQLVR